MGLFDKKKKSLEQEVLEKMQNSELLDYLISRIGTPEARWMVTGEHGQTTTRKVTVKPDGFIIEIPGAYDTRNENYCVAINFEAAGFHSLEAHYNEKGGIDISLSRMCYLYAVALQNRLHAVMKDCVFSPVSNDRDISALDTTSNLSFFGGLLLSDAGKQAYFSYCVPVPAYSNLF